VTKLEAYAPSTCGVTLHPLLEQVKMTLQFVRQTIEGDNPVSFWSYPKIELDLEIWQGIDRKG